MTSHQLGLSEPVGLFSGGKDSMVACYEVQPKRVLYCNTGVGLNLDFVKDTCQSFGWELIILEPKIGESFEDFVRKFNFPHVGMHNAVFGYLKWHPIRTWYKQQKKDITLISGRRKKESARRKRMKSNKQYDETEGMKFYSPIYYWSGREVYEYIDKNRLPLSPIYKTMHMSGDCFCGAFAQQGESQLLYTFHKELADYFKSLEEKYGGHWGNGTSFDGVSKQSLLDDLICAECITRNE